MPDNKIAGPENTALRVALWRALRQPGARLALSWAKASLAASLLLLVACGGGQSSHRGDGGDGGGRDGASDEVTQPPSDARRDAPIAIADAAAGTPDARRDVRAETGVAIPDAAADARGDGRADTGVAADAAARPDGHADAAHAGDASPDAPADAGPLCTLGTDVDCAACGDPACTLTNTLTACASADHCTRAVCAVGFGNCNVSGLDCEASFSDGGTCLPRQRWTTGFATDYTYTSWTTIGTDGSFFLAGAFRGTLDFDPTGSHDMHSAAGPSDLASFITKLNADGSYAWTRSFPEPGVAFGAVAAAADGAVVVVGVFNGSIDLDPGPGVDLHDSGALQSDQALVVKLASDGSLVWGRTFAGTTYRSYSSAVGVAVDAADSVYVSGIFDSEVDFDPGSGMALRTAPLVGDAMLVKLTAAGDFSWVQTINNRDCHTELWSVAVATDGTIWSVGWTGMGPSCDDLPASGPGSQPLVAAYSAAGDARGVWEMPPSQSPAYALAVAAGPNGSVYVGGEAEGLIDLDPGPGVATRWVGPTGSGFLAKLAPDASLLWAVGVPGISVNGIAGTADGGVLAAGNRPTAIVNQGPTAVVAKLGPDGAPGWTFVTGGPGGSADSIAVRGGSFAVAGFSQGSGDFDPGPGTNILNGNIRFLSRFDF